MKPRLKRIGKILGLLLLILIALNAAFFWLLNNVPSNAETEKHLIEDFEKEGLPVTACQPRLLYRTRFFTDNTFVLELTGGHKDSFTLGTKGYLLGASEYSLDERKMPLGILTRIGVADIDPNAEIIAGSMEIGHILYLVRDRSRVFLIRSDL